MFESPPGHAPALLPRLFIREAEVNALVDTDIDRIPGQIREMVIRERVRARQRMLAVDREGEVVRPEEELQRAGQGTNRVIGARSVVRIIGSVEQRFPGRVACRARVAIVLALVDGRDRAPENIVNLAVPSGDERISDRQGAKCRQPRIVPNIRCARCPDIPQHPAPYAVNQSTARLRAVC